MSDDNETYIHLFAELFRAVLRQLRGHGFPLRFPLTAAQETAAHTLFAVLINSDSSLDDQVNVLQNFGWELVSHKATQPWTDIFQFFFAILALRVDGAYACAANLSPELAKMTYLIRTICMAETLKRPVEDQGRYDFHCLPSACHHNRPSFPDF